MFDRFDICEAYWLFAVLYSSGGTCFHPVSRRSIFARLDRMRFRARPWLRGPEDLSENSREVFDKLESAEAKAHAQELDAC